VDPKTPGRIVRVALKRVAEVELVGLDAITDAQGGEFMPHPFAHTRSSPFSGMDEYSRYAKNLLDRIDHGDLSELGRWFSSYLTADLRVECSVSNRNQPQTRMMAHRAGDTGYLAIQQRDADIVEVFTLSPFELGSAIAGSINLTKPGKHAKIVIPDLASPAPRREPTTSTSVRIQGTQTPKGIVVAGTEITMFGRAQSRWRPARNWGFDRQKKAIVWVRIDDDGDYIYAPGFGYLTPLTARELGRRIDQLIAEDIAAALHASNG